MPPQDTEMHMESWYHTLPGECQCLYLPRNVTFVTVHQFCCNPVTVILPMIVCKQEEEDLAVIGCCWPGKLFWVEQAKVREEARVCDTTA